ncbi:Peptidoglycan D,D-transpeptidase FtsI [Streptomyces tendae]
MTEVSDRQPPRRRVPGPARPVRGRTGPGPGARPARRPGGPRPRAPKTIRLGSPRPRLRLVGVGLTLVMLAFVVRLVQVQAVDASTYAGKAERNRYVGQVLAAERGEITDRNGVALATSEDADNITADPTMFAPDELKTDDGPQQAAALLAPILGADQEDLVRKLRPDNPSLRYVKLALRQTPQVWTQSLGVEPDRVVWMNQVHGADVAVVDGPWDLPPGSRRSTRSSRRGGGSPSPCSPPTACRYCSPIPSPESPPRPTRAAPGLSPESSRPRYAR